MSGISVLPNNDTPRTVTEEEAEALAKIPRKRVYLTQADMHLIIRALRAHGAGGIASQELAEAFAHAALKFKG
jgi:hypothetical protein